MTVIESTKIVPHQIAEEKFARQMPAYLALCRWSMRAHMDSSLYNTGGTCLYNPFPKGALPTRSNKASERRAGDNLIMMHNKACKHWPVTTAMGDIQQQDKKPELHDTPVRKAPGWSPVTPRSSRVFLGPFGSFQI